MNPRNKEITKAMYLEKLIEMDGVNEAARKALGLSYNVYYNWRKTDPSFDAAVKEAMQKQVEFVENKFMQKIKEGNVSCLIFYLKTHGWREGKDINVSTQDSIDINAAIESIREDLKE